MPFIIGKKIKMDQIWDENGSVVPVTIISAGPIVVTQVKTPEKEGYEAFQVGYDATAKRLTKAIKGHVKELGAFRYFKEFKTKNAEEKYAVGDIITVEVFEPGDKVRMISTSFGRGFQGVVKRHGFHGGPKSHGQKDRHRAPGSIGVGGQQRVIPGRKMAGRMGNATITMKNIKIAAVDKEKNLLMIKGGIPGKKNTLVFIQK